MSTRAIGAYHRAARLDIEKEIRDGLRAAIEHNDLDAFFEQLFDNYVITRKV